LAAAPGGTLTLRDGLAEQVFLSGRISDMQARLNVANLVTGGSLNSPELRSFARLYQALNLPEAELLLWVKNLEAALQTTPKLQAPLPPQRLEQLAWLGISARSLARLSPYIAVLPSATPVNINTASAEVLSASVSGLSLAAAQNWVRERNKQPFDNLEDARSRMGTEANGLSDNRHSVGTRYFEVVGQLRQNQVSVLQRALVVRDGVDAKTPRHTIDKKTEQRQQPRFSCGARKSSTSMLAHADGTCNTALPTTHTITRTRLVASALSVSGVVFVGFSLQPLSRTHGTMRNKAARRQRPYACIRNALTTKGTNTMRNTF
jgi:hypothetical protein